MTAWDVPPPQGVNQQLAEAQTRIRDLEAELAATQNLLHAARIRVGEADQILVEWRAFAHSLNAIINRIESTSDPSRW